MFIGGAVGEIIVPIVTLVSIVLVQSISEKIH